MKYRERYDTKIFFKKRVMKVVIPLIFWMILMTMWKISIGTLKINEYSIKNFANIFLNNKMESTYYFMFLILGMYLLMPLISILTESKYRKVCWYTVIVLFVTHSCLPVILKLLGISWNSALSIPLGASVIFVLLGYLLSTQEINKKHRIILYCLGIISIIIRYVFTYNFTSINGKIDETLFGYSQFHSVLLACAVFVFFKNINYDKIFKGEKSKKILSKIASCSFGIYLIHKIVMHYETTIFNIDNKSWQWRTIGVICTYIISLVIIYLIKKIPLLKKIVP